MARIVGRRMAWWALSVLGLLVLAPLAVFSPLGGAFALAVAGIAVGVASQGRAGRLSVRCDKLSSEVDILSQRLVRLESVARVIADQHIRLEQARAERESGEREAALPTAEAVETASLTATLSAGVEEVTAEIGLLSGIVRELASVVATQDGEIARLKTEPAVPPAFRPAPRPRPEIAQQEIAVPPRRILSEAPSPWMPRPLEAAAAEPSSPSLSQASPSPSPVPAARDQARDAAMLAAFDGEGLEVHLQPVVSLPQRKVVSYEALARLRVKGETLGPETFLPVLERNGRTTDLDRRMLQRVVIIARHLGGRGSQAVVAYGLSPLSLFEPGFLRSLPRLVVGEPDLSGRIVVSLPQASWRNLDAEQAGALNDLRGRIGFALDRPTDLRLDPMALADRGISQVKVPADLLLRPSSRETMADIALEDLVASLARAGIRLVADGVVRESDVPDLIELDVPLAQGTVFAPARAVRAEVLAATPPPPVPVADPVVEQPEPPQRRPFRDFLRRAG